MQQRTVEEYLASELDPVYTGEPAVVSDTEQRMNEALAQDAAARKSEHPFCEWLRVQLQSGRSDAVGALASAIMQDPMLTRKQADAGPDEIRKHLVKIGSRRFVLNAYDAAVREWHQSWAKYKPVAKRRAKNKVARAARKRNRKR